MTILRMVRRGSHGAPLPLTASRPRDVALTGGGRLLVLLAVLLFAAAIVAGVALYGVARRQADERRAFVETGVTTPGVVTELWDQGDRRRRVGYEFSVNGVSYRGEGRVSGERRAGLNVGSPIDVRYVPGNPTMNDLGGVPSSGIPIGLPFVVAPIIAALGGLSLVGVHRQRRLLSEGRVASATVIAHETHKSSYGGTERSIAYQFPLLSGAVASGKTASATPPAVGSTITVVYDPDRPARHAVYPFSFVKPRRF